MREVGPAREADPVPVVLRPVRTGNAFEETVERLLRTIRLGVVPPGHRLPAERDLAGYLGVSRSTLREALATLHAAGWVEVRRGRTGGTFVRSGVPAEPGAVPPPEPGEVEDVLALRRVVEVGVVEVAAGRSLATAQRRDLRAHLAAADSAAPAEYRRCDSRLHLALAEATGSPSLVAAVADARSRLDALLERIPLIAVNLQHSNAQHRRIVAAVLAGDAARARDQMVEHVEGSAALLRGFLS